MEEVVSEVGVDVAVAVKLLELDATAEGKADFVFDGSTDALEMTVVDVLISSVVTLDGVKIVPLGPPGVEVEAIE